MDGPVAGPRGWTLALLSPVAGPRCADAPLAAIMERGAAATTAAAEVHSQWRSSGLESHHRKEFYRDALT